MVAPGPRVAPPGWARPSDLRAFAAYHAIRRLARRWELDLLERAGSLRGLGFTVRMGCLGGLDCVSCVSDGLCVCSSVTLVVLSVCVPPSKTCVLPVGGGAWPARAVS